MAAEEVHRLRWRIVAAYTLIICLASAAGGLVVKVLAYTQIIPRLMVGPLNGACAIVVLVSTFAALARNQVERTAAYAFWVAAGAWVISGLNVLASVSTIEQWFGAALVIGVAASVGVVFGNELRSRGGEVAREAPPAVVRTWTVWRIVFYSLLIGGAWLLAQIAVIVVLLNDALVANPELDAGAWSASIGSDGFAFAVSVIAGSIAGVVATYSLVRRHEIHIWGYIGFRAVSARELFWSVVVILGFVGISDGINLAIGREVVPPFVLQIYRSSGSVALLATVLIVIGPLAEEVMFRGYLLGTLESAGTPRAANLLVSAGAWAIVHVQYDAYGVATIFAMGLTLGIARLATTSILPCVAMHAVANTISLLEAVAVAHTAAA